MKRFSLFVVLAISANLAAAECNGETTEKWGTIRFHEVQFSHCTSGDYGPLGDSASGNKTKLTLIRYGRRLTKISFVSLDKESLKQLNELEGRYSRKLVELGYAN